MTTPPVASDSVRIELRIGDELATATLAGTPAARDLAAMLPLQVDLGDRMGQAKSGRGRATLEGAAPPHRRHVRHLVLDRLTSEQIDQLADISRAILDGFDTS